MKHNLSTFIAMALISACAIFASPSAAAKGEKMPDTNLKSIEGTTVQLSSLLGKKMYIDIWATWCGPCVREIPYMAKVVEQFKDNKDIVFLSLSIDDTDAPWLSKIKTDKPAWAQYRLDKATRNAFLNALSITSIPRFMIIDKDGTILNADAPRPSSPELIPLLKK